MIIAMLVIHAHWQPPRTPAEPGGVIFWAETSARTPLKVRKAKTSPLKPRPHPFFAPPAELREVLGPPGSLEWGEEREITLWLPTTPSGPLPSPGLVYDWEAGEAESPRLAPWRMLGIWLPPGNALPLLIELPSYTRGRYALALGSDASFWHGAAALVLSVLAAQKIVPVLAQVSGPPGGYHARWLPVLDSPKDLAQLAELQENMPPVCRADGALEPRQSRGSPPVDPAPPRLSPRALLSTFLNTFTDALARQWGRKGKGRLPRQAGHPGQAWLAALFRDDPSVYASPAQLSALAASHQAWMRNLHVSGGAAFRVAFRLEAPSVGTGKAADWVLHYLLQARDDPSLIVEAQEVWENSSGAIQSLGRRFEEPQEKLLLGLGYAARLFPPIAESLKTKKPEQLRLSTSEAYGFLRESAPLLDDAGFGLLSPPWWNKPGARLGLRLKVKSRGDQSPVGKGLLSLAGLVHYQWELLLGETSLTWEEFQALAALKSPLVQVRGQWVQLDPEQVEAAIQFWEKQQQEGELGLLDALRAAEGDLRSTTDLPVDDVQVEGWLAEWLQRLRQLDRMEELPSPDGLYATLRPYQRTGYSWLHFMRRYQLGACLADDMGLGKTVQTLAFLMKEKEMLGRLPAPVLLVCPTSVVANWEHEIQRFTPGLVAMFHQGAGRLRGNELVRAVKGADVLVTSYAVVRQDVETLQRVKWLGVILDEAQNIKNPSTKQTQSIRKLPAQFRLALTGTPVENRLAELWSIMNFLNPGFLGSQRAFRNQFSLPIERYGDAEAAGQLKKLVGPFILRRVKTDPRVIQDLPDKIEMKVYCQLTEEQATLYGAVVNDILAKIENSEGIERRGLVLSMLTQLKQICNHPAQYLHMSRQGSSPDARELVDRSGKLERLQEMLDELLAVGDRALIFTQYAEMGHLLSTLIPAQTGSATLFLHGGVPPQARTAMIRRFQEESSGPPVFILSLKAGGTGLNLTRASHVFHFDRWWNPAVEDQATDRAFRIGQVRNVQVHKFITQGTLEEKIDELIESKKDLAQRIVGSGESWLTELSTADLRELVTLRG